MRLKQNVGPSDRLARVIGGAAIAALARPPLVKAMGIYWALEGLLGYCLWYDIMNINSLPRGEHDAREEYYIPREANEVETDNPVVFSRRMAAKLS